jgi:hypothetical protein
MFAYGLARLVAPDRWPDRRAVVVLLVLACLYPVFYSTPKAIGVANARRDFTTRELKPLADWLEQHVSAESKIMVHDAGYLGYRLNNPMVDLVGLKTAEVIPLHQEFTWPSCGEQRPEAIARLINRERPEYLAVLEKWEEVFVIAASARSAAQLQPVWQGQHGYTVYSMRYGPARKNPR